MSCYLQQCHNQCLSFPHANRMHTGSKEIFNFAAFVQIVSAKHVQHNANNTISHISFHLFIKESKGKTLFTISENLYLSIIQLGQLNRVFPNFIIYGIPRGVGQVRFINLFSLFTESPCPVEKCASSVYCVRIFKYFEHQYEWTGSVLSLKVMCVNAL